MTDNDNLRGLPVAWALSEKDDERGELCRLSFESPETPIQFCEWSHTTFDAHPLILATDYAALLAERDELRADARRLDWLDSQRGDDVQCDRNGDPELVAHYWSVYDQCYDVRTAIDAAMAAEGRE